MGTLLVIDRFEGDFALIETEAGLVRIPRADLPENCREGDLLRFQIDKPATEKRKQDQTALLNSLFEK